MEAPSEPSARAPSLPLEASLEPTVGYVSTSTTFPVRRGRHGGLEEVVDLQGDDDLEEGRVVGEARLVGGHELVRVRPGLAVARPELR